MKKENERSSWKPERAAWLRKGYLDWKPEKAVYADIVKKYYAWSHQKKDLSELKTQKGGSDKKRKKTKKKEKFKVKT